ncbi:MAG: hypothetical protein QOE73_603 [Verrucomicrobiota bacterium]
MFAVIKGRWFFLYGALVLLFANDAYAGRYERTKEGIRVWNNLRGWGDEATWSGDRDRKGYAIGEGTLTWYRVERRLLTGSNIPFSRGSSVVVGSYSGKMVRGKFDGLVVSVDANEKTFHATFADGRKVNDWAAGPAPGSSRTIASDQRGDEQVQRDAVAKTEAEPPPPGEGPPLASQRPPLASSGVTGPPLASSGVTGPPLASSGVTGPPPPSSGATAAPLQNESVREQASTTRQANKTVSASAAKDTSNQEMDDSLKSLIGPPSFLRMKERAEASSKATKTPTVPTSSQASVPPTTSSSPPAVPRLTKANVIELADAEARKEGYNLGEYQRPQADYLASDETWSVTYDQMSADGVGKHFSISVEDKTKKTGIIER